MLGGDCLSLSAQGLLSTWPWNTQDTYHCPKCTHHLLPVALFLILDLSCHASSAALSWGLMCRVPDDCSSDFPEAEGLPVGTEEAWGGLTLGQMILGRRHPHISLAITPTSPLLANFLPAEADPF